MNTSLQLCGVELWQLAGWTMLHFLWVGGLVGLAAVICRVIVCRAAPSVRYVAALGCLCMLGGSPGGIAAWLVVHGFASSVRPDAPIAMDADFGAKGDATVAAAANGETLHESIPRADAPQQPHSRPSRALPGIVDGRAFEGASLALDSCAQYLPWLWLIGTPLTFVMLTTGLVGAERLRRASRILTDGPIVEACARLRIAMRISCDVAVATCDRIAAPVLVGIVQPIILIPTGALTYWSVDEIEMVLLHELAHVRRWDNLVNLAQRFVESLLFFHPAVWLVSGWVRREREACCDAVVVGRTAQPHAYAELLVALAAQMPRSVLFYPAASSAMAAGPLRARIRRILQLEDDSMLVSGKSFALLIGGAVVVATLAVLYLPARGQAKDSIPPGKQEFTTESTEEKSTADNDGATTNSGTPTLDNQKLTQVPFVQGATRFSDGDSITIREVRGTAKTFEPGNIYWIKGTYTLVSHDRASLSAFTTAKKAADGTGPIWKIQTTVVEHGTGAFTLCLPMSCEGWPHVSFYPDSGGDGFGGVYFGTGDSVLKHGWASHDSVGSKDASNSIRQVVAEGSEISVTKGADGASAKSESPTGNARLEIKSQDGNKIVADLKDGQLRLTADPQSADSRASKDPIHPAPHKFPSLEEQRLADMAWKRLGLELEPLDEAFLKQVKAFGYDGGVRAANVRANWDDGVRPGDFLVGLHVWPTTSLKEVVDVLNRNDLAELSPLKFYVVRPGRPSNGAFVSGPEQDTVVTGRISVSFDNQPTARVDYRPRQSVNTTVEEALKSDPNLAILNQQLMQAQYSLSSQQTAMKGGRSKEVDRLQKQVNALQKQISDYRNQMMQQMQATESPAHSAPATPMPIMPTPANLSAPMPRAPAPPNPQAPTPTQVLPEAGAIRVGGQWLAEEIAADPKITDLRQQLLAAETELQIKSSNAGSVEADAVDKLAELEQSIDEQAQKRKSEFLAGQQAALNNAARQAAAAMAAAQIALERTAKEHDELTLGEAQGGGRGSEVEARQAEESAKRLEEAKRQFEQQKRAVEDVKRKFEELRRQSEAAAGDAEGEAKQSVEEARREMEDAKREAEDERRQADAERREAEQEAKREQEEAQREAEDESRQAESEKREAEQAARAEQSECAGKADHPAEQLEDQAQVRLETKNLTTVDGKQQVTVIYKPRHSADADDQLEASGKMLEQIHRQLEEMDRQFERTKLQLQVLVKEKEGLVAHANEITKQIEHQSEDQKKP